MLELGGVANLLSELEVIFVRLAILIMTVLALTELVLRSRRMSTPQIVASEDASLW